MRSVDLNKLRIVLTPHPLRQSELLTALEESLYAPLHTVLSTFESYRAKEEREREYGPIVGQLRTALSDQLECERGRIEILDGGDREPLDVRRESEGAERAQRLGRQALPLYAERMLRRGFDFWVLIPEEYSEREAEARAVLERWKLAGTRYTIEWV